MQEELATAADNSSCQENLNNPDGANGVNETETPEFFEWYVKKGKVPLRRTGYPEDVSGTVIFLASKYCRYMTGQLLVVDGGLMSTF